MRPTCEQRCNKRSKGGCMVTMRAPPVLLCCGKIQILLPSISTCSQVSRATSCGRIPAYNIIPTAAKHWPDSYSAAPCINRSISLGVNISMRFSRTCGVSTLATGFSLHQPRFTAVPNTPLSTRRALARWLGVSNAVSIYSAHSCTVIARTLRFASPLHRFMNRRVMYRKSLCVLALRSFLASNAAATAFLNVTVFSCRFNSSAPSAIIFLHRFNALSAVVSEARTSA